MPSQLTITQRYLTTHFITKKRLNAPTVWLKPESATPDMELEGGDLNQWGESDRNAGLSLIDGWIEIKIKSPDDVWFKHFAPLVDARAAYGLSRKPVSSVILKVEDPRTVDRWENLWPAGHKDKADHWVKTELVYTPQPIKGAKPDWRHSSPLPGSRFGQDLAVWRPRGKPAAEDPELGVEDLENRAVATVTMPEVVRAIAFATLGYWVEAYLEGLDWDETLTRILGGWIARLVREGADINARGKSLDGACWSPVDSLDTAADLIRFLEGMGAKKDLGLAFHRAEMDLQRDPTSTKTPGWTAIETLFGSLQAKIGIRRAFRAGLDIDVIEKMSERYVYDRSTQEYLDRDSLHRGLPFEFKNDALTERHQVETVYVRNRPHNPFRLYSTSGLRTDVDHREFRPGEEPGSILRYSRVYGLLEADSEPRGDEFKLFNTFPGFAIKPVATVDEAIMHLAVTMLDRMLALLTQDNAAQMKWLKQFIAWIAQHPDVKPQVCPIIVGGQGIGKSFFGDDLMTALFGKMAGTADAASLSDNKFLITPFIGKLITFIDEVRLESVGAINIIKRLVRSDNVSGQVKFGHQKDWYIPSRLLIASNSPDIGLTPNDAADRAFFFILSYTAENMQKSDGEFLSWANELKPFYTKFTEALKSVPVRQHLMRYFMDFETTQVELENLEHSSRGDESVVRSVMSDARRVGRKIVSDARVMQGLDITAWFNTASLRDAIRRHEGPRTRLEPHQVLEDWSRARVIEKQRGDWYRFKFRYRTLLKALGDAHGLELHNDWEYVLGEDDGDNDVRSAAGAPGWRGNRQKGQSRSSYNSDYMPPED